MIGPFELLIILAVIAVALAMVGGVVALVLWLSRRNGKSAPPPSKPPSAPATKRLCPQCGTEMAADAPLGLCPNCLMKIAMGSEAGNPAASPVERKPAPPPGEIAKHFPQFEILTLLGQGGMGAVYKARQPALDRFVALKVLPAHAAADAGFAERFNREARALAKLSHPNIVAVYEFGQADGLHYLIMEFVDGLNLRQLQQTGRLPPREALEIIPQICEALQFAHDEGVVHRDIKPENVLLDKKGRVKIADFGLARILGREPESFRLTGTKDYMGTPHYMAPEQIEHPQAVDHRADIYSLGVVFYEMLTGELPLGKFQPPSKKVQVDVRLDEVVLHALEKEPERRYQHVSDVKSDVETIAHTPTSPTSTASVLAAQKQRRVLQVKSACFFFAAVCFLIAAASFTMSDNATAAVLSVVATIGFSIAGFRHLLRAAALNAAPGPSVSAQEIERVRRQVKGPATGLLVTGIANWILMPVILAFLLPNAMHTAKTAEFPQIVAVGLAFLPLLLCSFIIYAAFKMMQLERRGAAIVASFFAILVTPGNLIGLPMGIWALVVLGRPEVRQAFGKNYLASRSDSSQPTPPGSGSVAWKAAAVVGAVVMLLVLAVSVSALLYFMARSSNARDQARRAQAAAVAEQARIEMLHIKLRQAEETATLAETRFRDGTIPQSELQAAKDEVALLKAEVTGDDIQIAQVRLAAAENQLATVKALFDSGRIPQSEYQTAQNEVELRQAELRTVEPTRVALPTISANGTPMPQAWLDDVVAAKHFAGGDTNKLYYLIARSGVSVAPTNPGPLLLVLPGGDGGRDFQPFIKRICKSALPDGYLVAQLIAPKWDENQFANLVWPTENSRYPAMKFSTEEFVSSVIADIEKQHRLNSQRIFTLSWSSGGPAAYAISLHPATRVTGSFIAMSVFKPDQLPEAAAAKGHVYYLLHSPQDFIPMRMPELARDTLTSNGAKVYLQTYQGGHGWHGNVFGMIGEGIRWLEQQTTSHSAPPDSDKQ